MPLTKKEKRMWKHIYETERKRYGKKRARLIANAVVYSRKRKLEKL